MLLKLIKHEFKASYKQMWPIYLGMLGLSLLCKFVAFPLMKVTDNFFVNALSVLMLIAFFIGVFILAFMPLIVSGSRFKRNILSNEGYLTMTLPVTSHQLIISKLIVNAIWYALTGVLMIVVFMIMVRDFNTVSNVTINPNTIYSISFKDYFHFIICAIETLINYIALISLGTLIVYAAYAIGYSANKHKSIITVGLIYLFFHLTCWLMVAGAFTLGISGIDLYSFNSSAAFMETILLIVVVFLLLISAIFYFITNHFITKKLNLE